MKSSRSVFSVVINHTLGSIAVFSFTICLYLLAPNQVSGQCPAGYKIEVSNVCSCNNIPSKPTAKGMPADDRKYITVKVTASPAQNWTVKDITGLYSTSSPPAPADPILLTPGTALNDAGAGMYTLDAIRLTTTGFWVQVTNGSCDLDIMVSTPDPCAKPEICDGMDNDCDGQIDEDGACCSNNGLLEVDIDPDGTPGNGDEYTLYVHPTDNSTGVQWGPTGVDIPGLPNIGLLVNALQDFNGDSNTQAIVDALGNNNGTPYAAKICADLEANGCDNWHLPSVGEINAMYAQLGPGGNNNFANGIYWTSTEIVGAAAYDPDFSNGTFYGDLKFQSRRVRCVRK